MQKIISLFKRNYDGDRKIYDEIVPGAEWVVNGEGIATRKFDGTCCLVKNGRLFKRYDAQKGKIAPADFIPAQEPDDVTGHWPGWLPVSDTLPEDQWHRETLNSNGQVTLADGTYELIGPKIQGNPEKQINHILVPHGAEIYNDVPRSFEDLKKWFIGKDIEGIVWHHLDGRMVKIKKKDFGMKRNQ